MYALIQKLCDGCDSMLVCNSALIVLLKGSVR